MIKRFFLSTILLVLTFTLTSFATTAVIPSDDDLIVGSRLIVQSRVVKLETRQDDPKLSVFTYTTLQVSEVLKGQLKSDFITIKEAGGIYNGVGSVVFGMPEFSINEEVILFLDTWQDGSLRVRDMFIGKFTVSNNPDGTSSIARDFGHSNVDVLNKNSVSAKEDLGTFKTRIKQRVSALKSKSASFEAKNYSMAFETVPSETFLPTENFTFLIPTLPLRWFEADSNQVVPFKVNPQGIPAGFTVDNLIPALNAWSNVSSLRLSLVGTTNGCGLLTLDGENTISFNNCDNYPVFSPPVSGCSGILAAAGILQYNPSQTKVVNGITFYRAIEANLSFNPYASCYFNNVCNVQEIATHEMGHTCGAGHSLDDDATMRAYAHFDGRCATLKADDQNFVRFVYPGTGVTPTPTPTPIPGTLAVRGDFDGDRIPDRAIWDPQTGNWYILKSTTNTVQTYFWGSGSAPYRDIACPFDADSDGKTDVSVFRQGTGDWYTILSSTGAIRGQHLGQYGDIPLPGNYTDKLVSDLVVYRPNLGTWYILHANTIRTINLGGADYTPVKVDMDNDGILDPCVFKNGYWYYITSSDGLQREAFFGTYGSIPVPSKYSGRYDFAVWNNSYWNILSSTNSQVQTAYWGYLNLDTPQPLDFTNDGFADITVYRSSDGNWYSINSATGASIVKNLGVVGGIPVSY